MAERLGLTERDFRRILLDALGVPPKQWLAEIRSVEVRRRLLGEESIAEIARSVGFSHPKELAREFRKAHGVTPSQYRKRERSRGVPR